MKTFLKLSSIILMLQSFASSFVTKNMYSQHSLAQGTGKNKSAAISDANKAIPKGYIADSANSPTVQCESDAVMDSKSGKCPDSSKVIYTIPVVKK